MNAKSICRSNSEGGTTKLQLLWTKPGHGYSVRTAAKPCASLILRLCLITLVVQESIIGAGSRLCSIRSLTTDLCLGVAMLPLLHRYLRRNPYQFHVRSLLSRITLLHHFYYQYRKLSRPCSWHRPTPGRPWRMPRYLPQGVPLGLPKQAPWTMADEEVQGCQRWG